MPYVIEKDTNLPRVIASGTGADGSSFEETESVPYPAGAVVFEKDIAPGMLERLESGDEDHLATIARHVSESEAQDILAERSGSVAVVAEHEAEAEVLYQDGKDVLTKSEVVDLNLNGDPAAEEEVIDDITEEREPENPDSLNSEEVDAKRRGSGEAPEPIPAAEDAAGAGDADDGKTVAELKSEAKELEIPGYSTMNKAALIDAIDTALAQDGDSSDS